MKSIDKFKDRLAQLAVFGIGGAGAIALIVFLCTFVFAIIGWAVITVVGLFTTVGSVGYFGCTAIGIAVSIIVAVFRSS